jgi:hypothetical protein
MRHIRITSIRVVQALRIVFRARRYLERGKRSSSRMLWCFHSMLHAQLPPRVSISYPPVLPPISSEKTIRDTLGNYMYKHDSYLADLVSAGDIFDHATASGGANIQVGHIDRAYLRSGT